jgi:hypothetical protein
MTVALLCLKLVQCETHPCRLFRVKARTCKFDRFGVTRPEGFQQSRNFKAMRCLTYAATATAFCRAPRPMANLRAVMHQLVCWGSLSQNSDGMIPIVPDTTMSSKTG